MILLAAIVALFTTMGEIDINVDAVHAPKTAANFIAYVRQGAFNDGTFFRTVLTLRITNPIIYAKIDVIQATNRPKFVNGPPVAFESTDANRLAPPRRHRLDGPRRDLELAPQRTSSSASATNQSLDDGGGRSADHRGFAAFGQVVHGMDVVRKIHDAPHTEQTLTPPVVDQPRRNSLIQGVDTAPSRG